MNERRRQLVHQVFRILDRDRSGEIELADIQGVYNASAHPDVIAERKTENEKPSSNDPGHHKGPLFPGRGIAEGGIPIKPLPDRILPQDIEHRDHMGQRFHPDGVQFLQLRNIGQNIIELPGEDFDLFGYQTQTGQIGHVEHFVSGQGHGLLPRILGPCGRR